MDMSDEPAGYSRRNALKCLAYGGTGTLFALAGGVFTPIDLALAAADKDYAARVGKPLFVQISDTYIGFNKDANPDVTEYFSRFGKASDNKGYYSFDHAGVHFISLINVLQFKPGGLATLGADQLQWVAADLKHRSSSTPIVVFAHMPLWTIYEPWGWGTGDADQLMSQLRP